MHLEELKTTFSQDLANSQNTADLNTLRVSYLGKNGQITGLMKNLKDIPNDKKKEYGQGINTLKSEIESELTAKEALFAKKELDAKIDSEKIDVTLSLSSEQVGAQHPLTIVREQVIDIFTNMGFAVTSGPEIETDYYNFQALNIPEDHPAREMQDTFYINPSIVLRTHTSPVQARTMETQEPPIRIICPGKVYRSDSDATHSPMFQQIEGLVVDKDITLCDLKGLLEILAKKMFNSDTKVRFRPSYFPFTEPSVEVDVSCAICGGDGCRLCKGTGWIELLGAGQLV